jgi:hypothetical protein
LVVVVVADVYHRSEQREWEDQEGAVSCLLAQLAEVLIPGRQARKCC